MLIWIIALLVIGILLVRAGIKRKRYSALYSFLEDGTGNGNLLLGAGIAIIIAAVVTALFTLAVG